MTQGTPNLAPHAPRRRARRSGFARRAPTGSRRAAALLLSALGVMSLGACHGVHTDTETATDSDGETTGGPGSGPAGSTINTSVTSNATNMLESEMTQWAGDDFTATSPEHRGVRTQGA